MKILIVRFSSIGDIVLTSPVVRCLKLQLRAEIHYLTKAAFESLIIPNPYVDKIFSIKKDIAELMPALKAERYDLIVDLHHNLRSLHLKLALGCPARSFPKINLEKWLRVNAGIDWLPRVHIVHRYFKTVEHLGVQYDGAGLDFFVPTENEVNLADFGPKISPGFFTALVIGATHATKRLPTEKLIEISRWITQPVILLGGPAEVRDGEEIAKKAGEHVLNLVGKTSLHGSASIIKQSGKVIAHDTGLMHIAAAFRREIVSIWGSTIPEFGMYPFYPDGMDLNKTIEITDLRCRPCSKIGFDACPKGHFHCMTKIAPETVLETIKPQNPQPPGRVQ